MSFKVIYRGLEVFIDSLEELDTIADRYEKMTNGGVPQATNSKPIQQKLAEAGNEVETFLGLLKPMPLSIVNLLAAADRRLTDAELVKATEAKNNSALAGYMSSITKAMKKAGLTEVIQKKTLNNTPGERQYEYGMANGVKLALRRAVGTLHPD